MRYPITPIVPFGDNLIRLAQYRAEHHPEKPAYIFLADGENEEPVLTYGRLFNEACRIAALLKDRGVQGDPVILAYEASLDFIVAFWGCILSGNIAVPTYAPRGEQRSKGLAGIIENSGASIALTHQPYMKTLTRILDQYSVLRETAWLRTDIEYDIDANGYHPGKPHPTAVLQYTSGSTGSPKGVQITHKNIFSNEEAIRIAFGHDENAVIINCLPHYHDMGLFGNLLQPFYAGGLCVSMSPAAFVQKPSRLLDAITRYRGTSCGGPNFVFGLCADKLPASHLDIDLRSWNIAFTGAERIRPEVQRRFIKTFKPYGFRKEAFRSCYGLAEATLLVSMDGNNVHLMDHESGMNEHTIANSSPVSCGVVYGSQSLLIVNPDTKQECEPGHEGEVWLQGTNMAKGYWRNPAATAAVFGAYTADGRGPFLRTGDCGYLRDGELFISGRFSGFIIVDGENFHAEDLEVIAAECHPAIEGGRCMVHPIDADDQEDFVLIVEVARAYVRNFDAQSPGNVMARKMGLYGPVPRSIMFVKAGGVPSTPNGKINRQAGRVAMDAGQLPLLGEWHRPVAIPRHRNPALDREDLPIHEWLRAVIAERIGTDPIKVPVDQPFASLGIDSLALIAIAEELSIHSRKEIDSIVMWEYPTITELASHLSA